MAELNGTSSGKWSETDASNVSPSPDGWPSGTFPNQVEPIGRSTMGSLKRFWDRINGTVNSTGSSNAYIYTPVNTSFPTAYVQGETYTFLANFANTGAATININSLGTKNIFKKGTSGVVALSGAEINAGDLVMLQYDGTQMQMMNSLPIVSTGFAPIVSPNFTTSAQLNAHPIITQVKKTVITSTQVYTFTTGMVYVEADIVGGGGGGGGAIGSTASGSGGGAGERRFAVFSAATAGTSQNITIGAGGTSSVAGNGTNGSAASFGTLISANGGTGGSATSFGSGGAGGTGGTGGQGIPGQAGGITASTTVSISGDGGSSVYGAGGRGLLTGSGGASTEAGNNGTGFGSGGGGAVQQSGASNAGGNGMNGICIITEYISA